MTFDLDVLREQVGYIDVDPYAVAAHALRYGTPGALDLLALMATDGRDAYAPVQAAADAFAASGTVPSGLDPRAVGALAQALIGKHYRPGGSYDASARMHRLAYATGSLDDQPTGFAKLLVQTQLAAGAHVELDALVAATLSLVDEHLAWIVRTDRLRDDPEEWSASFTEIFAEGQAPVRIGAGEGRPFDRLEAPAGAATRASEGDNPLPLRAGRVGRPLVTVVMSVYGADESLNTAVRSIVEQTYPHLELLVVDDCSPAEHTAAIDAVADLDPRIRVLRMPENGGTYRVRNHALTQARGELVTFQDSDDWSHPERLARQVAALQARPEAVASLSSWVRMTPDLVLNRVGYAATRVNASSLMFRREPVVARLGGFDTVRKDADSEFRDRLAATYGEDALVVLPDVLAVAQLTADSLSRDDFAFGWWAPTREAYGAAYAHWHDRIRAGSASPMLDPSAPRPFPAPATFVDRVPEAVTCDVAYVSDWRVGINRYDGAPRRVRALLDAGLDVHVGQAVSLRHAYRTRRETVPEIRDLRADRGLGWQVWTEPVHARVTVVDSAELLMFPRSAADVRVTTDRLVVVAGSSPTVPTRGWMLYDPATVERNGRELFGVDVEWLPAHAGVADALRAAGASTTVLPPRSVVVADPGLSRPSVVSRPPVVGAARLEKIGKNRLPGAQLVQYLPVDGAYAVRVLDDDEVVPKLFRKNPMPPSWTVVTGVPLDVFAADVDVFAGFAPDAWGDGVTWPMASALAAGAVLLVDPRHRPVLGDAAVYATPDEARATLDGLTSDPAAFAAQRERGDAFVRSQLDPAAFAAYVRSLAWPS